jgi:hypothetical protein
MTNDWMIRSRCSANSFSPSSLKPAASQSTSKRRSMEVANCSATSDVTDSVCAVALPGAISSPMWSRRKPHGAMATDNTSVILSSGARAVELQWRLTRIAARL